MVDAPQVAPVLSTPDTHIFGKGGQLVDPKITPTKGELDTKYEIQRTISEIKSNRWKKIALQFPDHLLPDAPRVYRSLQDGLKGASSQVSDISRLEVKSVEQDQPQKVAQLSELETDHPETLAILGDTSYGSCCVDEVAAQHVSADAVVHYGRACLSPTSHLPALHIFTVEPLSLDTVISSFTSTYLDKDAQIILTSDVTYASHLPGLTSILQESGYTSLYTTEIIHSPTSAIPNRTVPTSDASLLKSHSLFHIGHPPQSLLLTLASRLYQIHIYDPHHAHSSHPSSSPSSSVSSTTALALRRRYALLTRLSRASIIGILINTLSVHAYLSALASIQELISKAGKKYYVFVVGKLNAAKIANFAEVGAWVVVGCWESSLVESGEFEKPVVVPWELELALRGDEERVWTGEWRGDFGGVLEGYESRERDHGMDGRENVGVSEVGDGVMGEDQAVDSRELDSEEESEPPEFDLRTGKYVQYSKPMQHKTSTSEATTAGTNGTEGKAEHSLIRRAKGDLARIGGEISPGAEFLRGKRTWRGLGSDFEIAYENDDGPVVKMGRSGIARGYQNEQDKP
ncbi:MAG: Diphthamide biosynthesis protein 2 [Stictis urceolatum]|nr:Diphthamide biosynthesis protein 2 [Stictis urceolata]